MNIIESFQQAKSRKSTIEDGLIVTNDFAAVIDGSTSKGTLTFGDKTSGRVAMETVCNQISYLDVKSSALDVAKCLTSSIREIYLANNCLENATLHAENRCTCGAIIFSQHKREIWMIGDCQCRFGGATYTNEKIVDHVLANIRSQAIDYLLQNGHTTQDLQRNDLGRAFIYDALKEQCHFQNANADNPYKYAVIDGFDIDENLIKIITVPSSVTEIILASDGYPKLCDTLQDTEDELARLTKSDPLCYKQNKATKGLMEGANSYDDRTYLRIQI